MRYVKVGIGAAAAALALLHGVWGMYWYAGQASPPTWGWWDGLAIALGLCVALMSWAIDEGEFLPKIETEKPHGKAKLATLADTIAAARGDKPKQPWASHAYED